jgi:glutamine synthetase
VSTEAREAVDTLFTALGTLDQVNSKESHEPHEEKGALEWATYMRDSVLPAMADVREACDQLERMVADDLWPLPRYSEMLFIK